MNNSDMKRNRYLNRHNAVMAKATSNDIRAERAQAALQFYVEAKGEVFEKSSSEIADLMADLLHLAVRTDEGEESVERCLRLARMHFDAEHNNPEEEAI